MTRDQLDAIRARLEAATPGPWQVMATASFITSIREDVSALLAEVERLTKLTEETEAQMHLRIRAGYDKTVADSWRAWAEKQSAAAFRRGVAAMRERVAEWARCALFPAVASSFERDLRALPDPEDTP